MSNIIQQKDGKYGEWYEENIIGKIRNNMYYDLIKFCQENFRKSKRIYSISL